MNLTNVLELRAGDSTLYGVVDSVHVHDGKAQLVTDNGVFTLPTGAGMQVYQT